MKRILVPVLMLALSGPALAQAANPVEHQQHHPGGEAPAATAPAMPTPAPAPAPAPGAAAPLGGMMQAMPEQCRAMMATMPEGCRSMMQQMMQARMMQGAMGPGAAQAPAAQGYMAAMERMHGPMMEGAKDPDPDVAFVRAMIPHHQGAIDMAKVALQHGKDAQAKKWANDVIREQQREIGEMEAWLKKRGK